MAALTDQGLVTPDSRVDVPASISSGGGTIKDAFSHGSLVLTARGVIAYSSNIGTTLLTRKMDKATFIKYLRSFGLGTTTGIGLPGEAKGSVPTAAMPDFTRDQISFGQGLSVTAIKEAAAVAGIVNGGVYHSPTIIKSARNGQGEAVKVPVSTSRRVISAKASAEVRNMMEAVVTLEPSRAVAGYRTIGKTGTAQRIDPSCDTVATQLPMWGSARPRIRASSPMPFSTIPSRAMREAGSPFPWRSRSCLWRCPATVSSPPPPSPESSSGVPAVSSESSHLLRPRGVRTTSWAELQEALPGVVLSGAAPTGQGVTGITLDSRQVHPGDLYVGLPGTRFHGARFASQALEAGAVAVLTDTEGAQILADSGIGGVPILVADQLRIAMAKASARIFGDPGEQMTMFGITGTNGKTTTAFLVEAGLLAAGRQTGTIGTIGYRLNGHPLVSARTTITTPEAPDLQALFAALADHGVTDTVMEVSSHALAMHRVDATMFDVAGFTNLGRDHLDFHKTMENYYQAKARLLRPGTGTGGGHQCR